MGGLFRGSHVVGALGWGRLLSAPRDSGGREARTAPSCVFTPTSAPVSDKELTNHEPWLRVDSREYSTAIPFLSRGSRKKHVHEKIEICVRKKVKCVASTPPLGC